MPYTCKQYIYVIKKPVKQNTKYFQGVSEDILEKVIGEILEEDGHENTPEERRRIMQMYLKCITE